MPKLDAIIFDFDGTLADVPLDFDFMKTKIAALGEVFMDERPVPDGLPALEWLEALAAQVMERDRAEGMEFLSRGRLVIAATELDAARDGQLFEFTRPTLATLRKRGVAAGVITRNISAAVKVVFPDIEKFIEVFIPREIAVCLKPNPGHLLQALDLLGIAPEHTLMVGDHPMDVETAKAAGAMSAAVTSGKVTAQGFAHLDPDFVSADVQALMAVLAETGLL
ncbi:MULTISPECIES: HAD-IA family hydrolase [unclassified Pseudodesulfovibrio]|uniref:HAD family hydrolase n=1 Tax=unclassified Pseudodesulfovibrio TaxID=2661612 RepID=UPI000FEBDB78|nr:MULTISPECIES: HAD-IA family hydrolase [unclassified Pseudodesulfovibrio]MCJ2165619.1 HAD-IA family hydrolase [Pseudodesulfovibrio sp. S3-i]RWU03058.1 HAD family hydrolase [Pseudodesulfovibrio sp. S3]